MQSCLYDHLLAPNQNWLIITIKIVSVPLINPRSTYLECNHFQCWTLYHIIIKMTWTRYGGGGGGGGGPMLDWNVVRL